MQDHSQLEGFTLIELSIVLVIIGLIVGGVLVGRDLIRAAEVRATISQMEKYQTAVNVFRDKYNALPGDMDSATDIAFGFGRARFRNMSGGQGDGNGLIDGCNGYGSLAQACGETGTFWEDLSSPVAGGMIEGTFSAAAISGNVSSTISGAALDLYFPPSKLGRGNYVYVFEANSANYFGIAQISYVTTAGDMATTSSMTVHQSNSIDQKMDDGLPATGNVQAQLLTLDPHGRTYFVTAAHTSNPPSATDCYDSTSTPVYALGPTTGSGSATNCSLTFKFH